MIPFGYFESKSPFRLARIACKPRQASECSGVSCWAGRQSYTIPVSDREVLGLLLAPVPVASVAGQCFC